MCIIDEVDNQRHERDLAGNWEMFVPMMGAPHHIFFARNLLRATSIIKVRFQTCLKLTGREPKERERNKSKKERKKHA